MTLSELIKKLEMLYKEHGNIEVIAIAQSEPMLIYGPYYDDENNNVWLSIDI